MINHGRIAHRSALLPLLAGWSSLENSKSSLDAALQSPASVRALSGWSLLEGACAAVETTILAARDLSSYEQAALSSEDGKMAHAVLREAIKDAAAALDELVAASAHGAENQQPSDAERQAAASFNLGSLEESGELLRKQGLLLAEWSSRNESLSSLVSAASRTAPQISSFTEGLRQANESGVQHTPELDALRNKLKQARVAAGALGKVSGVTLLRSEIESIQDTASGRMIPATRSTIALASQGITHANGAHSDEEMYGSEESFGRMIAAQEASSAAATAANGEPDVLIFSILQHTSTQAAEAARAQGRAPLAAAVGSIPSDVEELSGGVLLSAQILGVISSASLAHLAREIATGRGSAAVTHLLDEEVLPPGPGVATAVQRATERAIEMQNAQKGARGVESLLRDVVFDIAAGR